ncbi:MAG: carboxyl transferase domain-containing protein [Candidatus Neoclostridium sp.]
MKSLTELDKTVAAGNAEIVSFVNSVTDEASFVEADKFIGSSTSLGYAAGEGVVSGFAAINDVQVGIFAINGKTLLGGIGKKNAEKIAKCVNSAVKSDAPVIGVIDTSGARFAEGIEALEGYGKIVKAFSDAYGIVPTTLVIKGNNFGMLAYLPAFCDFVICYENSVTATASPLVLAAQSGADVSKVGTASVMAESGVSSFTVKNDEELKALLGKLIDFTQFPIVETGDDENRTCAFSAKPQAKDVIGQVFDRDSFVEIKKDYACDVITGFARLGGVAVGVVANNAEAKDGYISCKATEKVTDLVNTLESLGMPLVTLVDSKGAANCLKCQDALIKGMGELVYALNVSSIEKIAIITGNALGSAYIAFANKSVFDYVIAWEEARIGMLDSAKSALLVYGDRIAQADDRQKAEKEFAAAYEEENMSAVVVAEKGYIDNVIDKDLTRPYAIAALQTYFNKR